MAGPARVPHRDKARQLDTPLWGIGGMEIGRRQHKLAFKISFMVSNSSGRVKGWRGLS